MRQTIEKTFAPLSALSLLIHSQPDVDKFGCTNAGTSQFDELGQLLFNSMPGSLANFGIAPQGINKCM